MLVSEYDQFVRDSDWTNSKEADERIRIARYGIAAEVGALSTALKKKVLRHSPSKWNQKNEEVIEELGDCLWFITQLAMIENGQGLGPAIVEDINALHKKLERNQTFKDALSPAVIEKFHLRAHILTSDSDNIDLDEYQEIAFLTARTSGQTLLDVCLTRLLLYSTSIMAKQFPDEEAPLKADIPKYDGNRTLGMFLWHLSALSKLYGITLSELALSNKEKILSISNLFDRPPTKLYDRQGRVPKNQQFPSKFSVSYISTNQGKLQMFYRGRPLGDELDDNSLNDDGYRFHDALHLANAAILGWSPVLRSLMGLKRKFNPKIDSAEDGARARIVEEAIVKAIHSEAIRVARLEGLTPDEARARLFSSGEQVPFNFLKLVMTFAEDLEVRESKPWEWRKAIVEGHRLYSALNTEKQGTVTVDLKSLTHNHRPCFHRLAILRVMSWIEAR